MDVAVPAADNQHSMVGEKGMAVGTDYDKDVVAWAQEQVALLRAGDFAALDIEHIAGEIEDVGKSEQRELASRLAVLLAHLLKWQYQPERRGASWSRTLREQRRSIEILLKKMPSLRTVFSDEDWLAGVWADAVIKAVDETGMDVYPDSCPWAVTQMLSDEFIPQ